MSKCMLWTGKINASGYGDTGKRAERGAHRAAYKQAKGPIPPGFTIDHICHNDDPACPAGRLCLHRRCINPEHLEAVPPTTNKKRGAARKTHCKRGHPLSGSNLGFSHGRRTCKTCNRDRMRKKHGYILKPRTHCPRGHPYAGENLIINNRGQRQCRECARRVMRASYYKRKEREAMK